MSRGRALVVLAAVLSCARNQGTAAPPTTTPGPSEPPPSAVVPDDASVATAPPVEPPAKTNDEPRPIELARPTDEEFRAWDRPDPAAEAKLYAWDKANLARMLGYWNDLACFRGRVVAEGKLAFGSEPGSPTEERFFQFKRAFVVELDEWQKSFFAREPRVFETSKLVGRFLEAHEIVFSSYPKAFTNGDAKELEGVDAHWVIVEAKTKKYVESLGGTWAAPVCAGTTAKKKKSKKG